MGATPFFSGLPEGAGAAEAGWGLAGLGIYTSWALGSAVMRESGVGLCILLLTAQVELWCSLPTLLGFILTCPSSWVFPSTPGPQGPLPQTPPMLPLRGSRCQVFSGRAVMTKWTLCSGNKARLPCSGFSPHPHTQEHSSAPPSLSTVTSHYSSRVWRWVRQTGVSFFGQESFPLNMLFLPQGPQLPRTLHCPIIGLGNTHLSPEDSYPISSVLGGN